MNEEIVPPEQEVRSELFVGSIRSGPLPSPGDLAEYARIDPDLVTTIVKMAEDEGKHRRRQERYALEVEGRLSQQGLARAFWVAVIGLAVIAMITLYGNPYFAGVLFLAQLGGMVGLFLRSEKAKPKEP